MLCGRVRWARVGPWCVDLDRSLWIKTRDRSGGPGRGSRDILTLIILRSRITVYAVSIKAFSGLIHTVPQLSIFIITRYSAISTDIAFLCVFMRIYTSVSAHYISDIKHVGRNPRELNPQIESPSRDSRSYKFRLSPFLRRARGVYSVYSFVAVLARFKLHVQSADGRVEPTRADPTRDPTCARSAFDRKHVRLWSDQIQNGSAPDLSAFRFAALAITQFITSRPMSRGPIQGKQHKYSPASHIQPHATDGRHAGDPCSLLDSCAGPESIRVGTDPSPRVSAHLFEPKLCLPSEFGCGVRWVSIDHGDIAWPARRHFVRDLCNAPNGNRAAVRTGASVHTRPVRDAIGRWRCALGVPMSRALFNASEPWQ